MAKEKFTDLFANYSFSLTDVQQGEWQLFLRNLPHELENNPVWQMLHDLSYSADYTKKPKYKMLESVGKSAKAGK